MRTRPLLWSFSRLLSLTLALMAFAPGTAGADTLGEYVGYQACADCHQDIVDGWKTTPHAHAFATLKEQGEDKQSIPGCFKCHVTGYEEDGGYVDETLTPELKDVQCEQCHGPGRKHVTEGGDPELIRRDPGADNCRVCHTESQDLHFDYDAKKQWVHMAMPESSKAHAEPVRDARITLAETDIDFGNMTEGEVVERRVKVTNNSKEVVKFVNLTTS